MKLKGLEYLIKIKSEQIQRLENNKIKENNENNNNLKKVKKELKNLQNEYTNILFNNNPINISEFTFSNNNNNKIIINKNEFTKIPENFKVNGGKKLKSKTKSTKTKSKSKK